MSATTTYEIQVTRGGRWVSAGTYQDRGDAMRDARGTLRKRYLGIRVVEEIFDPERERYVSRTVYRDQTRLEQGGAREDGAPAAAAAAIERNFETVDAPLRNAALGLVAVSAALLMGIAGLFWLNLV